MIDTVWIATRYEWTSPLEYMLAAMSGFDAAHYRAEARRVGLDELVALDWEHFWTEGDQSHDTREGAIAWAEENGCDPRRILEITRDDVREALRAFINDEASAT